MKWLKKFWNQPNDRYRNFQIVFTILTLNFIIPAISYVTQPEIIGQQFGQINQALGGAPYVFPEAQSRLWRYLGAANVMTLGVMCLLLQLNLKKFRMILLPLVFLKGYNATLFFLGYLGNPAYPGFLGVALFDTVTALAFWYFAGAAYAQVRAKPDTELCPRPRDLKWSLLGWPL